MYMSSFTDILGKFQEIIAAVVHEQMKRENICYIND